MFEKEAEEYAENREVCGLLDAISEDLQNYDYGTVAHYNIDPLVEECFKDGAEFGYNKANEWHKDLPTEDIRLAIIEVEDCGYLLCNYRNGFWYDENSGAICAEWITNNIVRWKEIVLPKEIKENDLKD